MWGNPGIRQVVSAATLVTVQTMCGCSHHSGDTTPHSEVGELSYHEPEGSETLQFEINEGRLANHFYRRGPVAAHVVIRSGNRPRVVVAFPAGNGGVALWLREGEAPVELRLDGPVRGVLRSDGLRGVEAELEIAASRAVLDTAVLGSVRVIRDYMHTGEAPSEMRPDPRGEEALVWSRQTLDGGHAYELSLEPLQGASIGRDGEHAVLLAPAGSDRMRLRLRALSDDEPLTPIPMAELLAPGAVGDELTRQVLAFLAYDEKLLAGSWRFLTYFGRDTLISTELLMPVLGARTIEAALSSVLERLGAEGLVAHEEDIGEFAVYRRLRAEMYSVDVRTPIHDYSMIDSHFLLAPVAAHYLLETEAGRERAEEFLARRTSGGERLAGALRRNLALVLRMAQPFAESGDRADLIALEEGRQTGNWRDSLEGLGNGRVPYGVNVVLVPAALAAAEALYRSDLLDDDELADEAARLRRGWSASEQFFVVEIPRADAEARIRAYASELGIPHDEAIDSLPETLALPALALDGDGRPIPVLHSDEGFALLFTEPSVNDLTGILMRMARPFPAGLLTPVGMVVANPAYVPEPELRAIFGRGYYHGTVVWPWQQAMTYQGVRRQLAREDLSFGARSALGAAERLMWDAISSGREVRTTELWTWRYDEARGRYEIEPFGQGAGHQTESNAAQLWSTVSLALSAPD